MTEKHASGTSGGGRTDALKSLARLRVLVTRPQEQAGPLVQQLLALGAEPIICPTIRVVPPASFETLDAAIGRIQSYDWVIFTSVNGVRFFFERMASVGCAPEGLAAARLVAIGPATARSLEERGHRPNLVPGRYLAEAILDEIGDVAGCRILLPRADIARKALADGLVARGAVVDEVAAYSTKSAAETLPVSTFRLGHLHKPFHCTQLLGARRNDRRAPGRISGRGSHRLHRPNYRPGRPGSWLRG